MGCVGARAPEQGPVSKACTAAQPSPRLGRPSRGPAHLLAFSFQTREQLQADLLRCQAKIEDLEKLLAERGQVGTAVVSCPWGLGAEGDLPTCRLLLRH